MTTYDKLQCYIEGSLDFTLLRKTTFLLFCINGLLQNFILSCYVPHTVSWAEEAQVPPNLAVWALSTLSCGTIACRILVSLIADRKCVSRLIIYACGLFFAFLMCIPPLAFPGIAGSYCSVILFGFHAGLFLSRHCSFLMCDAVFKYHTCYGNSDCLSIYCKGWIATICNAYHITSDIVIVSWYGYSQAVSVWGFKSLHKMADPPNEVQKPLVGVDYIWSIIFLFSHPTSVECTSDGSMTSRSQFWQFLAEVKNAFVYFVEKGHSA